MNQTFWIALGWQLAGWIAVPAVAALAAYGVKLLQARTADTRVNTIRHIMWDAVAYAEQAIEKNPQKKDAAVTFAQITLDAHGIHLPLALIEQAVEAAVFSLPPTNIAPPAPKA